MTIPREFCFERGRPAERLDSFLCSCLPELTRSQVKKLIDDGLVRIAASPVKAGQKLKGGEVISVMLPPPQPTATTPQAIPLQILFEDRHLIVIDKPAGLVVHPAPGHADGTLVNALLHHCQDLSGIGGELRPGIVHRLDKDTSGVMVATKDDATHNDLARQFKAHTIHRRYVALVHGLLETDTGTVDAAIGRHPTQRKKMSAQPRAGRRAVTHWRVLCRYPNSRLTLVELRLETGRTHQIRVHMSSLNHPVAGDPVYGGQQRIAQLRDVTLRNMLKGLGRQALHAKVLGFRHPQLEDYLEFESAIPGDMQSIIDYLDRTDAPQRLRADHDS